MRHLNIYILSWLAVHVTLFRCVTPDSPEFDGIEILLLVLPLVVTRDTLDHTLIGSLLSRRQFPISTFWTRVH